MLFVYIIFPVFVSQILDTNKVLMLEIMRKTQYCCLEMLLLRNEVENVIF